MTSETNKDSIGKVVIVGGCGHVGLPLGVKFAMAGLETVLIDINQKAVDTVNGGKFPFLEKNGDAQLEKALKLGLRASSDATEAKDAKNIIFVTGTPVDEHLNPKISEVSKIFSFYQQYFSADKTVIMRSTLAPGTMQFLYDSLRGKNIAVGLAFCPERVAQGYALEEIDNLPQIVSAFSDRSFQNASSLFSFIAPEIIKLEPLEAELTKLMANSWRYLEFAIANQFYMIAQKSGVDFYKIYQAIRHNYPRAQGYKSPGFAAGPCLFKDTMQLASFFDHQFYLGHSAMLVNEGLASFVVEKLEQKLDGSLVGKTVGILGMTFKAENDDIRESLSFRVKKAAEFRGAEVIWHDPYLEDSSSLIEVVNKSHGLIVCTPHKEYSKLDLKQALVDVWGMFEGEKLETISNIEQQSVKKRVNE